MTPEPGAKLTTTWSPGVAGLPALTVHRASGRKPGPHLLVTGGVHGDEYEGPAAGAEFFTALEPARLAGTVTVLPVVNVAAWQARRRRTPVDDGDLNRAFPGDPAGPPTRRLAAAVFSTFVQPADAVIDLHSGGTAIMHLPMVGVPGDDERARDVLASFDHRFYQWRMPDVAGVFSNEAHRAGKIAVGVEWGGGGLLDREGVTALVAALARSLAALGLGDGGFAPPQIEGASPLPALAGDYQGSPASGLWTGIAKLGARITAGEILGRLHDPLSGQTTAVKAVRNGIIAALPHQAWLPAGAPVAYIG
ncbi:MAG: succinylglutamate desuccinylase/aspartoacylase family protein [Opitutaceae bacterium]|nr:succinylglutamate desuccinylase/aspartoacylase family protein [Opitutaceae bacterium]